MNVGSPPIFIHILTVSVNVNGHSVMKSGLVQSLVSESHCTIQMVEGSVQRKLFVIIWI